MWPFFWARSEMGAVLPARWFGKNRLVAAYAVNPCSIGFGVLGTAVHDDGDGQQRKQLRYGL